MMDPAPILWRPSAERAQASTMARFQSWLEDHRDLRFDSYEAMWRWSVTDLDGFWQAIWDHFGLRATAPHSAVLSRRQMPGAVWFPGAELNFVDQMLRQAERTPERDALICQSETFGRQVLSWAELAQQVANLAQHLRARGVGPGDRVVAILPNTPASIVACFAAASLGAIWSLCALDMGHVAVLDRFRQIEPKVLIAQDGYVHGGTSYDRREVIDHICSGLPSLEHRIWVPVAGDVPEGAQSWDAAVSGDARLQTTQVPFEHPLWVVYSSGTTGSPKPIVHGHGGVLVEGAKQSLHQDLSAADRFCWLTSSGWIMWNAQHVALGQGATVAMWDGAPNQPDLTALWDFVEREGVSFFGAGAAYFETCYKEGLTPSKDRRFHALRTVGSTGSPLAADVYRWLYAAVKSDMWLAPMSGGTDLCGAFVSGHPMMPVRAGEMQCRVLGNAVRAFDAQGTEVIGQVGELVCTEPMPAMPLYFWNDPDGTRLHESYFDTYPGIWRHGDWIAFTEEGGSVVYGRSDATINRSGLRLGSSEIY